MIDGLSQSQLLEVLSSPLMMTAAMIYFAAGVVKGTLGIGFPTTAVSLLAQVTDARTAITLVIIPVVVTNAWQVWRNRRVRWVLQRFWLLLLVMVLFIAVVSQLAGVIPATLLTAVLGVIITLYAGTSLYRPVVSIPDKSDRTAQVIAGMSAGVMGGLTSVWVPPILIYLNARGLSKDYFVSTTGLLLFAGSLILLIGYTRAGLIGGSLLLMSCLLLVPSLLGFSGGELIRQRLSARRFERLVLWFFLILGLNLVRQAFV